MEKKVQKFRKNIAGSLSDFVEDVEKIAKLKLFYANTFILKNQPEKRSRKNPDMVLRFSLIFDIENLATTDDIHELERLVEEFCKKNFKKTYFVESVKENNGKSYYIEMNIESPIAEILSAIITDAINELNINCEKQYIETGAEVTRNWYI